MSTTIRPEICPLNKYWISRERYYELKHFCLQYNELEKRCHDILSESYTKTDIDNIRSISINAISDFVERKAIELASIKIRLDIIDESFKECDEELELYLRLAILQQVSFTELKLKYNIPCGKDMFYDRYRKFFWILDRKRQ